VPLAHRELFIPVRELDKMIILLKKEGYQFTLPSEIGKCNGPTCSLTFDDGYYNNIYFLEIAEKYNIPFILFITSYNIINEIPFIWDIWEASGKIGWRMAAFDYRKLYENLTDAEKNLLKNKDHRPFTVEELRSFASHPLVHLAAHTHTHQPIVGRYRHSLNDELDQNIFFLRNFHCFLPDDFSVPCGLYTASTKKLLLQRFQRIYTIDAHNFSPGDRFIGRISLINPDIGGDLISQIKKALRPIARMKRKMTTIRHSCSLLNRF
jgi:peptidoglycan/xylan/chitin deacetylase (PgdA/CDA1 family)